MTTLSWSTPFSHDTNAGFRVYLQEFIDKMTALGLVQTADTGQLDPATADKSAGGVTGYFMFRLNDSLQATAPIFMRFTWGGGAGGNSRLDVQVGTGTNGAGTLTGLVGSNAAWVGTSVSSSVDVTAYLSSACLVEGFFGLAYKRGRSGPPGLAFIAVCRSVDDTGAPTGEGFTVYRQSTTTVQTAEAFSVTDNVVFPASSGFAMVNMGRSVSAIDADTIQVYRHYTILPRVRPNPFLVTVQDGEVPSNTIFQTTVVGVTPRTYLALGSSVNRAAINNSASNAMAMLWE